MRRGFSYHAATTYSALLLWNFLFIIFGAMLAEAMPAPSGQGEYMYDPVVAPVQSVDATSARPVGVGSVADGGDHLSLLVGIDQFTEPVDLYLALYVPAIDSQNIYLLTGTGFQTLSQGLTPWRRGVSTVNADIFGQMPISALPQGGYTFYLLVTPSDRLDAFYLYSTTVNVLPPPIVDMAFVPGGCFQMGDTFADVTRPPSDELPVHTVCLSGFYIDRYEVTQAEYKAVMGTNPSFYQGQNNMFYPGNDSLLPVESVTWFNANDYCAKAGKRLPTEAEWEYAARSGGQNEKWAGTSNEADLGNYAWYWTTSPWGTNPVGKKLPNGLGLYDMTGNVWEWVADWYGPYSAGEQNNPTGPASGSRRVARGGSWYNQAQNERITYRNNQYPNLVHDKYGIRCARTP